MSDGAGTGRQQPDRQVHERTRELETMLEVSRYLASKLELGELLPVVFQQLGRVVEYHGASVSLLERDGTFLLLDYLIPQSEGTLHRWWQPHEEEQWLETHLNQLQEPVLIPDILDDSEEAANWRKNALRSGRGLAGVRSWMGVPLIVGERGIGMLTLEHEQPHFYTAHHARLALALGHHIAVAVENARLFKLEQRRAEQLHAVAEVSREISGFLAVDTLANHAAYLIQQAFGYYHVHIGLIEGDAVRFRPTAGVWREERACPHCDKHRFLVGEVGAAGWVAATGQPLLVPDVQQSQHYLPMDAEQKGSALIMPLTVRGEPVGVLNVESERVDGFSEGDIGVLQPLASQLAVALENARLYEQARALASLQERQKLARELHDNVSQALYGIGLGTQTALQLLQREGVAREELVPPLEYVRSLATSGLAEMRALIFELRPETLRVEGLVTALGRRLEAICARHELEIKVELGKEPALPLAGKEMLYRVAQEALQNVVKHANATQASISLTSAGGETVLEVRDNGRGFDPLGDFPGHLGLKSMRERAQEAGGELTIESSKEQGTTVRVHLNSPEGNRPAAA